MRVDPIGTAIAFAVFSGALLGFFFGDHSNPTVIVIATMLGLAMLFIKKELALSLLSRLGNVPKSEYEPNPAPIIAGFFLLPMWVMAAAISYIPT